MPRRRRAPRAPPPPRHRAAARAAAAACSGKLHSTEVNTYHTVDPATQTPS
jgi:hypothetical protein